MILLKKNSFVLLNENWAYKASGKTRLRSDLLKIKKKKNYFKQMIKKFAN